MFCFSSKKNGQLDKEGKFEFVSRFLKPPFLGIFSNEGCNEKREGNKFLCKIGNSCFP